MAKEHPDGTSKKEKKHKSKSTSEENGVKKSKKEKRSKSDAAEATGEERVVVVSNAKDADGDQVMDADAEAPAAVSSEPLLGELVPFANPLADDKVTKKVLKSVKKAAKHKHLKRGVKEVVKSLRKSTATSTTAASAVVVIAADISPPDVISHLPVLCEDHSVPYIYVRSRAALGAAGATKRPTSVVMLVAPGKGGAKKGKDDEELNGEEWTEAFGDLVKVVEKASRSVRI